MKRTILLAILCLATAMTMSAYDFISGGLYYNKNSDGKSVTVTYQSDLTPGSGYDQRDGDLIIPSSVSDDNGTSYSVTAISAGAFQGCDGLTSVTIPNSVTSIGSDAFSYCYGLTSVNISDLAAWCNIKFGDSLSNPLYYAHHLFLNGNEIKDLVVPNSFTKIGNYAFWGSGLTSVTIPNSVTTIGKGAFSGCNSLIGIEVQQGNTKYDSRNDCNAIIETASNTLIAGCQNTKIPNSVASIGEYVFSCYSGLTNIIIPSSVTEIGNYAFYDCSGLTSVTIPNSVTTIGDHAFFFCRALSSLTIGDAVTSIGEEAFYGCSSLTSIYSYANAYPMTLGNKVFRGNNPSEGVPTSTCQLHVLPGYRTIYKSAPQWKDFTNIIEDLHYDSSCLKFSINADGKSASVIYDVRYHNLVPDVEIPAVADIDGVTYAVTAIGDNAFQNCSDLASVTIPESVTSIGYGAFRGCIGMPSIVIPNSVTSIGSYAFQNCKGLTSSITIPNSVTYIGIGAFSGLTHLRIVTIGNSVTSIGGKAFENCSELTRVNINDLSAWCNIKFGDSWSNPLYYAHRLYLNGTIVRDLVIPSSVTSIGSYAFQRCILGSVTISNSVTSIGNYAFCNSGLHSVTIGNSVTAIGNYAFQDCSGLRSFTIPNSVTSIGDGAFYGCSGLTSFIIPNSVTTIGDDAFVGCSGLTSFIIPNSVTTIGANAFVGCSSLTSIDIPNSVTTIDDCTFSGCSGLTSVTIPNSITTIGIWTFSDCSSLTSIDIPNSVTSIGQNAFEGCSSLTAISIPSSVKSLGATLFDSTLRDLTVYWQDPITVSEDVFSNCYENTILHVPGDEAVRFYQARQGWKLFKTIWGDAPNEKISTLAAPNALEASDVTSSSFIANWNAVDGAISYNLYVGRLTQSLAQLNSTTTFIDKTLNVGQDELAWDSSATPYSFDASTYARGVQWSRTTPVLTASIPSAKSIDKVTVVASTNSSATTIGVAVGGTQYGTIQAISSGTANCNASYEFSGSSTGEIAITLSNSSSVWVKSIAVSYTDSNSESVNELLPGFPINAEDGFYEVTGLDAETTYAYYVTAVSAEGEESDPSETIEVVTLASESVKGDINDDGSVDGNDVSIMLEMVLAGGVTEAQLSVADINGDTSVDGNDVSILLEIVLSGE